MRKVFHLSTVIVDHRERSPLGGVKIGDDMVANNGIELDASEGPETFSLLSSQARRIIDRRAQRGIEAAFVRAYAADRLLNREQRLTACKHWRAVLTNV